MKGKSTFQIILMIVFGAVGILGVIFFGISGKDSGPGAEDEIGPVSIWGTVDQRIMDKYIGTLRSSDPNLGEVKYIEKNEISYNSALNEALASGAGPDLFLLSQDNILRQGNKVIPIPYESYSVRRFKDAYIEESELYLANDGILGMPLIIDPMVMYYNRDTLSREGISVPPSYWDEFFVLSPKITKRDQSSNILQATVALGEYSNVEHAKEVISALILQAGNPIVIMDSATGRLNSSLSDSFSLSEKPAISALRFYTEFSNPIKSVYSWNRALQNSRLAFLAGDLAFYFGFASELAELRRSNPNLNFDVAPFPQVRDDETPVTFGHMNALAISKTAANRKGAVRAAFLLTSNESLPILSSTSGLPPVSRQLLKVVPPDAYSSVFYHSALISQGWLDPNISATKQIFKSMVEAITSGRLSINRSVNDASDELRTLLK